MTNFNKIANDHAARKFAFSMLNLQINEFLEGMKKGIKYSDSDIEEFKNLLAEENALFESACK